jgi:hypothetical protein
MALLLFSIGAALFGKLDLLMLQALGGTLGQAGILWSRSESGGRSRNFA